MAGELTYGLERLAMYLFDKKTVYDLPFNAPTPTVPLTYGDVFLENEQEQSAYNFEVADTEMLFRHFADAEKECGRLIEQQAAAAGLRPVLKACHCFNLLDARGVISVTERQSYIGRVRDLAKACCEAWLVTHASRPGEQGRAEMAELLLELFSEEIPARMQARAADDLKRLVGDGLKAAGLAFARGARLRHAAPAGAGGRRPAGGARRCQRGKARPARRRARPGDPGLPEGRGPRLARPGGEARHRQGRVLVRRRQQEGRADRRRRCPASSMRR